MRKKQFSFYVYIFYFFLISNISYAQNTKRIYLSGEDYDSAVLWDFKCSSGLNRNQWSKIPVPSNWEMAGFGNLNYGSDPEQWKKNPEIGYYKYNFEYKNIPNSNVDLVFQGSMTDTEVKINNKIVGDIHHGGFTPFKYNVTSFLKDGDNLLEVKVQKQSNNASIQKSERMADFWLFGGIFRPVYLELSPKEHIERLAIDADMHGKVKMDVFVNNLFESKKIKVELFNLGDNSIIGKKTFDVNSDSTRIETNFNNVKLWSDEYPNLYLLKTSLCDKKGKTISVIDNKIGFRTFEVRNKEGFFLNGKRLLLKGASRHSFRPSKGRALSKKDWLVDIERMKDMNMNVVRCCTYPPDQGFIDLCDEKGLMVIDEITGWIRGLDNVVGPQIVEETVCRDQNHPSVILWTNGNHLCYNPLLEKLFYRYDIQKRRAMRAEPKTSKNISIITKGHDPIDTRYYPDYSMLKQRLDSCNIVFPLETLHALYDGGGGAGLYDFWNLIEKSKVGGGLVFWALYDEGAISTVDGFEVDVKGNLAPDGLLGPNGERKGSADVVKKLWSPVFFNENSWDENKGMVEVKNKYLFTPLQECTLSLEYLKFAKVEDARTEPYILKSIKIDDFNLPAGKTGLLKLPLFEQYKGVADAVRISVFDRNNNKITVFDEMLKSKAELSKQIFNNLTGLVKEDENNKFKFVLDGTTVVFNPQTGILDSISGNEISASPFIVAKSSDKTINGSVRNINKNNSQPKISKINNDYIIETANTMGFDSLKWILRDNGILTLEYSFTLPKDRYSYTGVGFKIDSKDVVSKKWLGRGPYRVYKNRINGGTLNTWYLEQNYSVPGIRYTFPEFEGFFSDWYWIALGTKNHNTISFSSDSDLTLGVLVPKNNPKHVNADWEYPKTDGIYFFNDISPVGSKWKKPELLGPMGELQELDHPCKGRVNIRLNYKNSVEKCVFKISLE